MNRRDFVLSGLAGVTASALPLTPLRAYAAADAPFSTHPMLTPLRGYAGQDVACDRAAIEGTLPQELRGVFYRNGPALFERGLGANRQRYEHWFDGDGMVHAWRFTDKGVSHQGRFVQTKKFMAEQAANQFLVSAFGTGFATKMPVRNSDDTNAANTNVVKLGDRLVAMWEGGSGWGLDPASLDTQGLIAWSPELKHMPFSAHPKVEADGTLWNFGALFGKMVVYHLNAKGTLVKHAVFDAPASGMVHDFAITEKHLVFLLPPVSFDREAFKAHGAYSKSLTWNANGATKVLIVDKDDFSKRRVLEMPPFMLFHFGNAWEKDNVIRVDFVRSKNMGVMTEWMPKMMRGEMTHTDESTAAFVTIDLKRNRCDITTRREHCEFPRMDPRFVGLRNRNVYYTASGESKRLRFGFPGVMRLDVESGKTDRYTFGDDYIVEEHVVVPKPASTKEGEGWLVGVVFDVKRQQSFATVFDALNLAAGPQAIARLPYWTPICFHGNFYAA
jgi:all-trans-8'-apo-beta-carotenal 15,15'-oxygenase